MSKVRELFRTVRLLAQHECSQNAPRTRRPGEDAAGWLPLELPEAIPPASMWVVSTDGSGQSGA